MGVQWFSVMTTSKFITMNARCCIACLKYPNSGYLIFGVSWYLLLPWCIMIFVSFFLFSIFLFLNQTESEGTGVNTACMEISELQLRMSKRSPMIFPERWDVTPCCGQGRCAAVLNHSMPKLGMTTRNDKYPEDNCKAHHIPAHYETEQCKQVLGIATGINELCGFV
jgi:hypothetical protein